MKPGARGGTPSASRERLSDLAIIVLFVALAAGIFGFSGGSGTGAWLARVLFFGFLGLFVVMLVAARWSRRSPGRRREG